MIERNKEWRCVPVLFLLFSLLVLNHQLYPQELIENGSFNSDEGWTVYNMGGNTPSEAVFAVDDGLGPAAGNGPYLFLTGEDTYTNILVWQVLALEAGKTYQFSGAFKDLTGGALQGLWSEIYLSLEEPIEGTDYTPPAGANTDILMNFSSWDSCGPNVDGTFQDNACGTPFYTAPGNPGEMVTIYFGVKTGVWSDAGPYLYDVAIDELSLVPVESSEVETDLKNPADFTLYPNFPNPFNPSTTISFSLPKLSEARLAILDIKGYLVKTLFLGSLDEGMHSFSWDGRDENGSLTPSGLYLYHLRVGQSSETRRMIFLK
jgi:hypothetical protein